MAVAAPVLTIMRLPLLLFVGVGHAAVPAAANLLAAQHPVSRHIGRWTEAPRKCPSTMVTDAPIMANGDMGAAVCHGGSSNADGVASCPGAVPEVGASTSENTKKSPRTIAYSHCSTPREAYLSHPIDKTGNVQNTRSDMVYFDIYCFGNTAV